MRRDRDLKSEEKECLSYVVSKIKGSYAVDGMENVKCNQKLSDASRWEKKIRFMVDVVS